jgi:hypothetical protein
MPFISGRPNFYHKSNLYSLTGISPCGFCCGENGNGRETSPGSSGFLSHYHYTSAPYSHVMNIPLTLNSLSSLKLNSTK